MNDIIIKDVDNESVGYTLTYSQDGKDVDGNVFAKEYELAFDDRYNAESGIYSVTVSGAKSYSGIEMNGSVEVSAKILGDVDGDGEVTVIDATYIQRYEAGFNIPIDVAALLLAGDIDGDGEVGVIDATYILRYDAGFNIPYTIGEST